MDHHERKPAVVVRLTNQLQFVNILTISLTQEKGKKAHLKTLAVPDDTFMKAKREKEHYNARET
jgi:hypothetical protein